MATHDWINAIQTTKRLQVELSETPELHYVIFEESKFKIFDFYNQIGEHQYDPSITAAYKVMSEVTKQAKRFEQALYYYQAYSNAKQLNLDQDNAKLLAIQKAEFDAVEKTYKLPCLIKKMPY